MPNQLSKEKSPYLQQHKDNPVNWFPWGDEAFSLAKELNKPIFLSIGYATCHWCHVMEHESFEDMDIAALMNDAFINVKVDREERPDIDNTYMTVCQMLNGHGGWPLSIVLTPDKEPFFAATYIPKEARFNRIGLRQLIPGIKGMWTHEPGKIRKAVEQIRQGFERSLEFTAGDLPDEHSCADAAEQLMNRYDDEYGGFGSAPKFPSPHNLMFLLRQWKYSGSKEQLSAVAHTLKQMRLGGIWDHVGGGFHRYSTDRKWLLPHFEKMLYDQALMIMAYSDGFLATQDTLFKNTIHDTVHYVFTQLRSPEGAFYSAEDADSEGEEGKFYVWTKKELSTVLSTEDMQWMNDHLNLTEEGNFEDEATREKNGTNILHLSAELDPTGQTRWNRIRSVLDQVRSERTRPLLDDKILCDWNALMIAALAKAGTAVSSDEYIRSAETAFSFLIDHLWVEDSGILYHRYKDGERAIAGFADDYTSMIWASLELYESTFSPGYLKHAIRFTERLIDIFLDEENGGFIQHPDSGELPFPSQKQIYDGAIPSANSMAIYNLIRLSRFTGDTKWETVAQQALELFSQELKGAGSSITMGMMSVQFYTQNPTEIVVTDGTGASELIDYLRSIFIPNRVLIAGIPPDDQLGELSPFTASFKPNRGKSQVYICTGFSCQAPVGSVSELMTAFEL